MYNYDQPNPIFVAAYFAMEILKPVFVILIAGAILWIIARFLVDLCSVDGGRGRREQRQRHRLQLLIFGIALACGVTGVIMTLNGYGAGTIEVDLPGGMKIHNGGMAVVFTSAMLFILWFLVRMLIDSKEAAEQKHEAEIVVDRSIVNGPRLDLSLVGNILSNMSYFKAGIATVALLPFLGPVALLPAGFLAFKAWQRQQRELSIKVLPPSQD